MPQVSLFCLKNGSQTCLSLCGNTGEATHLREVGNVEGDDNGEDYHNHLHDDVRGSVVGVVLDTLTRAHVVDDTLGNDFLSSRKVERERERVRN